MKIILSRKGFDSRYGGQPSPILPDGTLLSLPIPSKDDTMRFTDLYYEDKSYYQIIKELKPKTKIKENYTCHLDPDIRCDALKRETNWKGLFGQTGNPQRHLQNQGVDIGDIFLFFGWFKATRLKDGELEYIKDAPDLHVIFGYLEIGKIYNNDKLPMYAFYHPHASRFSTEKNNCIYEASDRLSLDESKSGSGCLKYDKKRVLTKQGKTRSFWDMPDIFREVNISHHSEKSFKEGYFCSAKIGQEFVIGGNKEIVDWTKILIV